MAHRRDQHLRRPRLIQPPRPTNPRVARTRPLGFRVCGVLSLAGCLSFPPADIPDPVHPPPPHITDLTLECAPEEERWLFEVQADAWAAAAQLWWTADGDVIESHLALSVEAAADGTSDRLRARLDIVADPRDVVSGRSTALSCGALAGGVVHLFDLDGQLSDCAQVGAEPARVSAVATCEEEPEPEL